VTIELDDATAVLLRDICWQLDNNVEDIGFIIREAAVALPRLDDVLIEAGIDISAVERPDIPKLVPGRKYKPPTT
jgi:hypothetical protein